MSQSEWSSRLAQVVGLAVKHYRGERKMSAEKLSQACAGQGLTLERAVIANLENGRRGNVSISEVIVLAKVLEVSPLALLFPLGRAATFEILPGLEVDAWSAARWFTGEGGFGDDTQAPSGSVALFREHHARFTKWREYAHRARAHRLSMRIVPESVDAEAAQLRAERDEALALSELRALRSVRERIRELKLEPPDLAKSGEGPTLQMQLDQVDQPGPLS